MYTHGFVRIQKICMPCLMVKLIIHRSLMKSEVCFLVPKKQKKMQPTDTITSTLDTSMCIKGTLPSVTAKFMLKYIFAQTLTLTLNPLPFSAGGQLILPFCL